MKDSFINCKEHIGCQNTWRGEKYKGKDPKIIEGKKKAADRSFHDQKKTKMEISYQIRQDTVLSDICSLNFSVNVTRRHTSENNIQILEVLFSFIVYLGKEEKIFFKIENKKEKITRI